MSNENNGESFMPFVGHPYSYAFGRSSKAIRHLTLYEELENSAKRCPLKYAVVSEHENIHKTFTELLLDVKKVANSMRQVLQVTTGDRVAIMTSNCYNFVVTQYACAKIGVTLCPINAYYMAPELDFCLKKLTPKVLMIPAPGSPQEACTTKIYQTFTQVTSTLPLSLKHVVFLDQWSGEEKISQVRLHRFEDLLDQEDKLTTNENNNVYTESTVDPDDICALYFTSGTTGQPKAAAISHFSFVNNSRFTGERLGFSDGPNEVICVPVPVFHAFGSMLGTMSIATTGATVVMPGYRYDVKSVVETIVKYGCTNLMGVPAMLIDIRKYVEDNNVKITTLTSILAAATTVPYEVVKKFANVIPSMKKINICYGATETAPIITAPWPKDSMKDTLDNVGIPLDHVQIKLVDKATGKIVKIGETGELHTRGFHVMQGYLNDPEQTRKVIDKAGWYNTGDLATMDERGYIRIVGRTKEMIIRGGINVYPREIEEVLLRHPLIENAAVCGVPHDRLGEEVCAWIKLKDQNKAITVDEVRSFCKTQIAYFKIPTKVLFVNEFPMTRSGKVQKFKMTEESKRLLAGLK